MKRRSVFIAALLLSRLSLSAQVYYAGTAPAAAVAQPATNTLGNNILEVKVSVSKNHLQQVAFTDKLSAKTISFPQHNLFELKLKDGTVLTASDFQVSTKDAGNIASSRAAVRLIDRLPGKQLTFTLVNTVKDIHVIWQITLHDSCNFIQQHFHITDPASAADELLLVNVPSAYQPQLSGTVDGSPVIAGNNFFALEHPMAQGRVTDKGVQSSVAASATLRSGNGFDVSVAWGITPEKQLRRGFLCYLEKVRAVPYRPFPHYNSWYDVGYDGREITEANAMEGTPIITAVLSTK